MPKTLRALDRAADIPFSGEGPIDLPQALGDPWIAKMGKTDILGDAATTLLGRGFAAMGEALARTPLLYLALRGPLPDPASLVAFDFLPGRPQVATQIFSGTWTLAGKTLRTGGRAPWSMPLPSEAFGEALHGFSWLRHLRDHGGDTAKGQARALVTSWLKRYQRYNAVAWRPHVTARRLMSWLAASKILWEGSDLIWRCEVLRAMARQARFLALSAPHAPDGLPRLTAAMGLALSGFCLSDGARRAERGFALLEEELDRQILPDGGHISRSPEMLVDIFADLVALKATLETADRLVPDGITRALDKIAPMVRLLRHGDGRLALFNGADEGQDSVIDTLLARAGATGSPFIHARHSGYHRLEAGRSVLIADGGAIPRGRYANETHAAPLAFEFSCGAHRLIVNCGAAHARGEAWRKAARASAAHSTLTIEDCAPARLLEQEKLVALVGPRFESGPANVKSASGESAGGRWLWMSHDGYLDHFALIHERRLFLDPTGRDLRGEDRLTADPRARAPETPRPFAIRFHLHPDVRASLARDGRSVLMLLPNGDGWRLRCAGGTLSLEESVYLGRPETVRKAEQIVISGETDPFREPQAQVKWAIHRLMPQKSAPIAGE